MGSAALKILRNLPVLCLRLVGPCSGTLWYWSEPSTCQKIQYHNIINAVSQNNEEGPERLRCFTIELSANTLFTECLNGMMGSRHEFGETLVLGLTWLDGAHSGDWTPPSVVAHLERETEDWKPKISTSNYHSQNTTKGNIKQPPLLTPVCHHKDLSLENINAGFNVIAYGNHQQSTPSEIPKSSSNYLGIPSIVKKSNTALHSTGSQTDMKQIKKARHRSDIVPVFIEKEGQMISEHQAHDAKGREMVEVSGTIDFLSLSWHNLGPRPRKNKQMKIEKPRTTLAIGENIVFSTPMRFDLRGGSHVH
ncbi:hypothetical protein C8J56DRAFT_894919 [Mycena floridula]|nr:hypothetical protein C8J56DRAFT_894919 [Mycena floridula]